MAISGTISFAMASLCKSLAPVGALEAEPDTSVLASVKGVLSKEKSAEMVEKVHAYLESFGLGYKRDDPTTHKEECMPVINEKGMMMHYGLSCPS